MRNTHVVILVILVCAGTALACCLLLSPGLTGIGSGIRYSTDARLPAPSYYTGIDFDTLKSNDHLTVIPLKSFRQQSTNFTCGPVAAMTVMSYYGVPLENTEAEELKVAWEMNTSHTIGTNPEQIAAWFTNQGWNATWGTNGTSDMLISNLKNGIPTMVEWIDWGGHWVVLVGYDTRGTEDNPWDDVVIFADSSDCADDRVDGISYFNWGQFQYEWFDAHYFPANMSNRTYVIAMPRNATIPSTAAAK